MIFLRILDSLFVNNLDIIFKESITFFLIIHVCEFELVVELVKLKLFPVKHCAALATEKLATASAFTEINLVIDEFKKELL